MAVSNDVKRAYAALTVKGSLYTELWRYYDGDAPMRYVSDRVREVFQFKEARFALNWAAVVIDSELERIHLKQFGAGTAKATADKLNVLYRQTELDLDSYDVHLAALVCGEAFVFVWKDEGGEVEAYYNDPRLCHIFYDAENPRKKSLAAKWWIGADSKRYLNLYYDERIEYYVSRGKSENVSSATAFVPLDGDNPAAENPFGVIPIFHFRPERRVIKGRLANVIDPQDAVNKLFSDMMVAAEFGAFRQRWFVTQADLKAILSAPDENMVIPAGDGESEATQVGQFEPTELTNYLNAIDSIASKIAIITRTPKHFIFAQGGDPSGEALIALEAPLNKKVQTVIDRFMPVWADVGAFMLKLSGASDIDASSIVPMYERPETVQPRTTAEIREINQRAGMPLRTTLKREGWTEDELAELDAEPPDKRMLVDLAEKIASHVDNRTYLETIAPAFQWNEQQIATIEALAALREDEKARSEARGFVEGIFPNDTS